MRGPGAPHIAQCDAAFRAKFFGAWGAERFLFYGRPDGPAQSPGDGYRQAA